MWHPVSAGGVHPIRHSSRWAFEDKALERRWERSLWGRQLRVRKDGLGPFRQFPG